MLAQAFKKQLSWADARDAVLQKSPAVPKADLAVQPFLQSGDAAVDNLLLQVVSKGTHVCMLNIDCRDWLTHWLIGADNRRTHTPVKLLHMLQNLAYILVHQL